MKATGVKYYKMLPMCVCIKLKLGEKQMVC